MTKAECHRALVNEHLVGMMISGGRFGITASNSSLIPCVFLSQQTHIPLLLTNSFATTCFSAGYSPHKHGVCPLEWPML